MRTRLNVKWFGRRTTARFPPELWALALAVYDYQEEDLRQVIQRSLVINEKPSMSNYTASGIVRQSLLHIVYDAITPVGFNPDPENG